MLCRTAKLDQTIFLPNPFYTLIQIDPTAIMYVTYTAQQTLMWLRVPSLMLAGYSPKAPAKVSWGSSSPNAVSTRDVGRVGVISSIAKQVQPDKSTGSKLTIKPSFPARCDHEAYVWNLIYRSILLHFGPPSTRPAITDHSPPTMITIQRTRHISHAIHKAFYFDAASRTWLAILPISCIMHMLNADTQRISRSQLSKTCSADTLIQAALRKLSELPRLYRVRSDRW